MAAMGKFILSLILLLFGFQQGICLELDFNSPVYTTHHEEVLLRCGIVTDLTIKQVVWYKLIGNSPHIIYYYEPSSSLDVAKLERASRSPTDNTSLSIYPVLLMDEGMYTCHVEVWDRSTVTNSTLDKLASIPVEKDARMKLIVNVPPSDNVQLTVVWTGSNMTLTCKATNAKPKAEITWLKTTTDRREEELKTSSQMIVENHDGLSDTTGHIFYSLSTREKATKISCVVRHPDTNTVLYKNVTLVSPAIQHAVKIFFDRLGENVSYSSIEDQVSGDIEDASGLVKISADPGLTVPFNSSVTLTASAPGVFPLPNFIWWTGERAAIHGPELYISNLKNNTKYYVLAENPAGKVLLSVPLTVVDAGHENGENTDETETGDDNDKVPVGTAGINGGLIAAIVIGCLLVCLLIGVVIWYCTCKNPPNKGFYAGKPSPKKTGKPEEEADAFMPNDKPLMRTTSTQTLEGRRSKKDPTQLAKSEDNLLRSSSRKSGRKGTPPPDYASKKRPMSQHLKEYGDSASFVEEHGSRDGMDTASSAENLHSAHEGDGDSQSERSIPVTEDSRTGRHVREAVV